MPRDKHRAFLEASALLPSPTDHQTDSFAEYISRAHNWYEHLPLFPSTTFYFYLDPYIGESPLLQDHIDRFGYWNYYVDISRSVGSRRSLLSSSPIQQDRIPEDRFSDIRWGSMGIPGAFEIGKWIIEKWHRHSPAELSYSIRQSPLPPTQPLLHERGKKIKVISLEASNRCASNATCLMAPDVCLDLCWAYDSKLDLTLKAPAVFHLKHPEYPKELSRALAWLFRQGPSSIESAALQIVKKERARQLSGMVVAMTNFISRRSV